MKKFLSILLTAMMILAMGITAFAEELPTNVTFNDANRIYEGYRLFDLSISLKGEGHHVEHEGEHDDDCYNYSYTVNSKYFGILQAETHANGRNEIWTEVGGKPENASSVTEEQILDYFEGQTPDNGTMRQVADRIYRAIIAYNASLPEGSDAKITPDESNLTGTKTIVQGYWMFIDVTNISDYDANSLVIIDTAGEEAITINPKTALPTVEKKVKDIEDTEDSNILDNEWHDTADHDIGDLVPFKLTATLPGNLQSYKTYKIVFHDTFESGFTFDESSVKVLMYDTKHRADADFDLNDSIKDVTSSFVLNVNPEDCTFEIGCENVLAIEGVTKDTAFVVYYEATLNENAVIGGNGNSNSAYLEFSNNAYDATKTGKTENDTVTVYTYQLVINKIDDEGHALKGAVFALYKKVLGQADLVEIAIDTTITADTVRFVWSGLDDGDYILKEVEHPEGYNAMDDVEFAIVANHSENAEGNRAINSLDGGKMGAGETADGVFTGVIENDIVNHTGIALPETGAEGTFMLIAGGSALVILAAVFMITRKKMSVYED